MSLISRLKTVNVKQIKKKNQKLEYLDEIKLKQIVGKGLAELYKIEPSNPITFLANWLLNESNSRGILEQIAKDNVIKEQLLEKERIYQLQQKELQEQMEKQVEEKANERNKLKEMIVNCDDYEDHLNEICEKLKDIIGATGVYISKYDLKRKYPIEEEDDETGHIDPSNTNTLQYIHWCNDHSFLHRQYLEPGTGVTYNLITPKEDEDEQNQNDNANADEDEDDENKEKIPKDEIKSLFIPDVIEDPNIIFFREPKLGCYLSIDIRYQSSMQYSSLLSAIANLQEYKVKFAEQEKRNAEKEENEENKEENQIVEEEEEPEANEANQDGEGEGEEGDNDAPVVLQEFTKEEKIYILSIDTLGQDRMLTEDERKYLLETGKLLRDSMTAREVRLLEKDRDIRIKYLEMEKPIKDEFTIDRMQIDADAAVKDHASSEEFMNQNITDEELRSIELNKVRARSTIDTIYSNDLINLLNMIEEFEFVEFEKIFQNLFYFAKIEGNAINEVDTHKLSWKKARKIWRSILGQIKDYDPIGPKPGKILSVFKGNVILENLTPFLEKEEEITEFSFALMKLVVYVIDILKVRKDDITRRYEEKKQREKERNEIIQKNINMDEERQAAIEAAEEAFNIEHGIGAEEEEEEEEEEKKDEGDQEGEGNKGEGEKGEGEEDEGEDGDEKEEDQEKKENDVEIGEDDEGEKKKNDNKEDENEPAEGEDEDNKEGEEIQKADNENKKEGDEEAKEDENKFIPDEENKSEEDKDEEKKEKDNEEKKDDEEAIKDKEEDKHKNEEEASEKNEVEEKEEDDDAEEKNEAEEKEEGDDAEENKEGEEKEVGEEENKEGEEGEVGEEGDKKKKKRKPKPPKPVFNKEEFLAAYDEEHAKLEVPDEIVFDLDEDFDMDLGGDEEEENEEGNQVQQE